MNKLKFTMKSLTAVCLFLVSLSAQAQLVTIPELKWAKALSGSDPQGIECKFVDRDLSGAVVTAGTLNGTADFDPGTGVYNLTASGSAFSFPSIHIKKYDSSGNFQWAKELGYESISDLSGYMISVSSLTVDESKGDIYVTGIFSDSTIDFDPGVGVQHMIPEVYDGMGTYGQTIFILKLNASGEFQWVKQINTLNSGEIISGAIGQGSENAIINFTGYFYPPSGMPVDFNPNAGVTLLTPQSFNNNIGFVLSLNGAGEFGSVFQIGNDLEGSTVPRVIRLDHNGNMYVLGSVFGTIDIDPSQAVQDVTNTTFIVKYNASGTFQWVKQMERGTNVGGGVAISSSSDASSMSLDTNGGIYISAGLNGAVNFDKTIPYGGDATLLDAAFHYNSGMGYMPTTAIAKYNTSGVFQWVKQIGGKDTANRAQYPISDVAENGTLSLSGSYYNEVDLDPGTDSFMISGSGNYIAQYDQDGNFLWAGKVAEKINNNAEARSEAIRSGKNGDIYICGQWSQGDMDFDPTQSTFILSPVTGTNYSGYVVKLNIAAVDTTNNDTTTSINSNELSIGVKTYPNPTIGLLNLEVDKPLSKGRVTIHNVSGQELFRRDNLTGRNFSFDLTHLSPGMYYLELHEGGKKSVFKLVRK